MGLFEQNPWLLIPIIILTVEGWNRVKAMAVDLIRRRTRSDVSSTDPIS